MSFDTVLFSRPRIAFFLVSSSTTEVALRQRTTTARALLLFSRSSARTMTITLYGPQQTRAMRATWMLRE